MWCDVCRNKGKKNSMADGIKHNFRTSTLARHVTHRDQGTPGDLWRIGAGDSTTWCLLSANTERHHPGHDRGDRGSEHSRRSRPQVWRLWWRPLWMRWRSLVTLTKKSTKEGDQKGDMNQAYKSLGKMDKCHPSLLYGDDLAKRVKSINDTNWVAQSLTAGSSGTHRGGQLRWNTGHNETYFVAQSTPVAFLWVFVRSGLPTLKPWKVVLRSGASEITFAIESFPYGTVYPHML